MMNAQPGTVRTGDTEDAAVDEIVHTGADGAIILTSIATAVVIGLWVAFYFFVFVPRSGAP
jgi:hypothetical protein